MCTCVNVNSLITYFVLTVKYIHVACTHTEHITIPITLPKNPLFAQPMFLRVVDIRLGGYNKPVVANGVVKLDTKIPSTEENPNPNYIPPATQVFISPEETAVAAKADADLEPSDHLVDDANGYIHIYIHTNIRIYILM